MKFNRVLESIVIGKQAGFHHKCPAKKGSQDGETKEPNRQPQDLLIHHLEHTTEVSLKLVKRLESTRTEGKETSQITALRKAKGWYVCI